MKIKKIYWLIPTVVLYSTLLGNKTTDSLPVLSGLIQKVVTASMETEPAPQPKYVDSLDDPAIWLHPSDSDSSLIFGADKAGGLIVYNLKGEQIQYFDHGNIDNIDLRNGFILSNDTIGILAASNQSSQSISLYRIYSNGILEEIHSRLIETEMKSQIYGLCMYKSQVDGSFYVFVNSYRGEVEQWKLIESRNKIDAELIRQFEFDTITEGMVADDEKGILYVAEERKGIWKINAEPEAEDNRAKIAKSSQTDNEYIRFDIEGLTIYYASNGDGYLMASLQGNSTFAIFERAGNNQYLGSFRIVDGIIDGAEETDGLEATNLPLGSQFPNGALVVQDGYNYDGDELNSQNFKIVDWDFIASQFEPKLIIDPNFNINKNNSNQ